MLFTLSLLAAVPILIYIYLNWTYDYWRKRGVAGPKAKFLVGSFPNLIKQKQHFAEDINDIYKQYKATDNYVGVFLMRQPMLMILDPKSVHDVLSTNFKNFHDNESAKFLDAHKDPLLAKNPFVQSGQEWKEQRTLITPGMTGTRVKVAYSMMQDVCRELCKFVENEIKVPSKNGINGKDLALRYTSENVCDSVLGIKANSFTENPLPISKNVRMFAEENSIFLVYTILSGLCPFILKLYKAKFIPQSAEDFFLDLMKKAFRMRQESKIDRQDFLNHVLSLKEKKGLSDMEMASHTMTFLIDGLDTTGTVISHCLLLLARNAEVQTRLFEEIREHLDENGELTFEQLNELPFLDACLHESIRFFSPGLFSTKVCTEPFEFTNKDGQKLRTRVGETVLLPLYAIHKDAEYFPNPEAYDPERFMPENGGVKKYRDLGLFLPFIDGPRMCLGMRFALVQSKAAISALVKTFNIKVNPKTKPENILDPKAFLACQEGGVWLDFEKRA